MAFDPSLLLRDILEYHPDRHRYNHLLKVTAYAVLIGSLEGMEPERLEVLRAAALLHDIGIKASVEKYGSGAWTHQQTEGPPIAERMLAKYGCPPAFVERVKHLIAHHHEYDHIDGPDYQALVEADFLVNCDEQKRTREQVLEVRTKHFRTAAGTELLNRLFELE